MVHSNAGYSAVNVCALSAVPSATYRIQLNSRFTFRQAAELAAYLDALGISHCYTSPYLKAREGSPHGYDIVDHRSLNPELGTRDDYEYFIEQLQQRQLGHLLDFVPNHMGVMGRDNQWWLDVLENGPASVYAGFFDIDWQPLKPELHGKVLLPILGDHYGNVLENALLQLEFDSGCGEFFVSYFEHRFPIDPREYPRILNFRHDILAERLGGDSAAVQALEEMSTAFANLPHRYESSDERHLQRRNEQRQWKQCLQSLCARHAAIKAFIDGNVMLFNGRLGNAESFDYLHHLLEAQAYRLAFWQVAGDEINYRRFFDINVLAGIRVEDARVFEMTHAFLFELIAERKIQGLRIDHIDGLNDPLQYLQRLHQRLMDLLPPADDESDARPFYIVAEKILAAHEHLDGSWPVAGTTGYEFADLVNGLFVQTAHKNRLDKIYHRFIGARPDFGEIVYQCKNHIAAVPLASELNVLANQLARIAESDRNSRDYTVFALRNALLEIVACFPVYRTYSAGGKIARSDRQHIEWALSQARQRSSAADLTVFDFVRSILLPTFAAEASERYRNSAAAFTQRLQQYTAPVMAKGFEDTALYRFCRLLSLNDVGGEPRQFGSSTQRFHHLNQERQLHWPHTLLNVATHDSKRSGDVRARINVLSEIPGDWQTAVKSWSRRNRAKKQKISGKTAPSRNDEYLFYQTLIGTWPLDAGDNNLPDTYRQRLQAYMLKAVREAKEHSSWRNPCHEYENALAVFIDKALHPAADNLFLHEFAAFQARIVPAGLLNALAQLQLLLTVPGAPDIYQGSELWNFNLVDPDNRRPVDFALRRQLLNALQRDFDLPDEPLTDRLRPLVDAPHDGRIKLYLLWKTLQFRRQNPVPFKQGHYLPLETQGRYAEHLVAFARIHQQQIVVVAVPRLSALMDTHKRLFPLADAWSDTWVQAPPAEPASFRNVLTGETVASAYRGESCWFDAGALLASFPTAMLVFRKALD
ncbi:MAG: malto-oligosyltrehalose synthase [Gammaproteobacteria bacterium]